MSTIQAEVLKQQAEHAIELKRHVEEEKQIHREEVFEEEQQRLERVESQHLCCVCVFFAASQHLNLVARTALGR